MVERSQPNFNINHFLIKNLSTILILLSNIVKKRMKQLPNPNNHSTQKNRKPIQQYPIDSHNLHHEESPQRYYDCSLLGGYILILNSQLSRMSTHRSLLLSLVIVLALLQSTEEAYTLSSDNTAINGRAKITYYSYSSGTYSTAGKILISFPAGFIINSTDVFGCLENNTGSYGSCTVDGNNLITFNWPGTGSDEVTFFFYVTNPPYTDTFSFNSYFTTSSGSSTASDPQPFNLVTKSIMASSTISYTPTNTNAASTFTFQFTTVTLVPPGGSLYVEYNYGSANTSATLSTPNTTAMNTSVVGIGATSTEGGQRYIFSKIFSGGLAVGSTIRFTLSKVACPPTTDPTNYTVIISTTYTSSYATAIDSSTFILTAVTDSTIANSIGTISNFLVGDNRVAALDFQTPAQFSFLTDSIYVTTDTAQSNYLTITTSPSNFASYNISSSTTLNISTVTSGMKIYATGTAMLNNISSGVGVQFTAAIKTKAMISSGVKYFTVQLQRSGYSYASVATAITVKPNSLNSASYTSLTPYVSKTTTYYFTIGIKNPLGIGAAIKITLPSQLSIATGTCVSTTTTSFSSFTYNQTCTASTSTSILIQNITNAILVANTVFTITVAGITNPISTKTTSTSFVIQTYYSSSQMLGTVDDTNSATLNSTLFVTASALIIGANDFNISRNSTTNLAYAFYTISYRVNSKFKANGYITLSFPSSMTLSGSASSKYKLTYANGSLTTETNIPSVSTIINSTAGTYTLLCNFSNAITVDLATNTIFTFTIDSLQNYPSLKPISPQIKSFSNDGYAIEESATSSITITNTVENTALITAGTTSTRMNGQSTTCTFQLTSPAPLASGSLITLELQNTGNVNTQMYLGTTTFSCLVGGIAATCSQDAVDSRLLKITTGTALSASTVFVVSVSSIVLSRSFDTPGRIYFRVFQTVGTSNYNISSGTLTPLANTLTNSIKSLALNILDLGGAYPSQLNQLQTFQITITPTNRLQSGDVIVVSLPSEYSYVLASPTGNASLSTGSLCTVSSDFHCSNNNSSPLLIRIVEKSHGTGFGNVSSVKITINNGTYRSPQLWSTFNSNIFLAYTYSITGQPVDMVQSGSINTTFYLACTNTSAHCKTCTGGLCDSCYQVGTGADTNFAYGGYFYKTSTKECVTSCGGNFYNLSNTCQICLSPCYGCSVNATYCSSCINSTYKLYNNSCLTGCPNGYYADNSNVCQSCSGNCLTCSVTASNCTSCTGSYLSTVTSSCVSSTGCESYQYPDSASFKCTNCSIGCVDCTTNATLCKSSCSTGYIIDIKYNTNTLFPAQCTNVCPDGKANDTTNSLGLGVGCRCNSSVCATCVTTINTCLTCSGSLFLKNTSCLASCGSGYYVSNNTCYACPSTCISCSSSTFCTGCLSASYWVYNGLCINACPDYTTKAISNGSYTCITCSAGCTTCQTATYCVTCLSPNYIENINNSQYCTSSCSSGRYLYGTSCIANCPSGYIGSGSVCIVDNSTISNSNATITNTLTSSSSRFIPFPTTIGLLVLSITTLASKVALPITIVPAALSAFGGLAEIIAWFIFIIAAGINSSSSYPLTSSGMIIVVIALIINWGLNALSLYFFKKYVWEDTKFQGNLKKLRNKTKSGVCVTYTCFVVTAALSHKFIEIMFSNLFEAGYFIYKVEDKVKLTPLNYIRYVSLIASVLAIVGAAAANYENQTLSMDSFVFIQSIDLIIVTLLAAIGSLWATARKADDYQNNISEKRNDMEEQFEHDPIEDDANHFEKEAKIGNSRSKYIHTSMTSKMGDPRENPLNPRQSSRVNPIGVENNYTNMPLDNKEDDDLHRINLNDMSNVTTKNRRRIDDGLDLDEIQLEQITGDNLLPRKPTNGKPKIGASQISDRHKPKNNGLSNRYIKNDPNSLTEKDKEKQKLKDNIENQLSADQIQRTKVIKDVDQIDVNLLEKGSPRDKIDGSETFIKELDKNGIKKQKLQTLSNTNSDDLNKLSQSEREKAGEIKNAMSLLQAKKVNIGEYLEYLDIIEEEDEDRNSDDYDQNEKKRPDRKIGGGKRGEKGVKKDKTQRKVDKQLYVHNSQNDPYDDEPKIPDFNHSPIRARNPTDAGDMSQFDDFNRLSSLKKSGNNRSEQMFKKNKHGLDDLVLISHESGDNYDLSLGDEFQRGNTLQPVDKDELPPSNLYQTEKMTQDGKKGLQNSVPIGKDRIVPNHLLYDGDHIEFVESEGADNETVKGDIIDFNNDVSPSQFNEPNLRIQSDEISDAPTKPRLTKKGGNEGRKRNEKIDNNGNGKTGFGANEKDQALQIEDIENDEDEFNHEYDNDMPSRMNRYQSNRVLDYDQILQNKKQNEKMKKLEQIYLPRINVNKNQNKKKRNNYSSHSYRKDELK